MSSFQPDVLFDGSDHNSTVDSGVTESIETSVDESIEVSHGDLSDVSQNGAYRKPTIFSTGPSLPGAAGPLMKLAPSSSHLPNLETHQHSTLFYLSLIEGRCRTQAASILNAGRHPTDQLAEDHVDVCALARPLFAEMSKELHKAGILPDEFAGQDLEDLRGKYLNTFDTALQNIAARAAHTIPDHSLRGPNLPADALALTRPFLHPAMDKMTIRSGSPALQSSLFSSLILRGSGGDQSPNSIFQTQYGPKSLLGRGGFGNVYQVRNLVDDREYAVKRIVIRSKKLNQAGNKNHHHNILMEAKSLSKLNHQNIVRYYGAWVEACPASTILDGDISSAEVSYTGLSESDELLSRLGRLTVEGKSEIEESISRASLGRTQDESDVFERSMPVTPPRQSRGSKQVTRSPGSPSALNRSPRSPYTVGLGPKPENNMLVPRSTGPRQAIPPELDAVLFIKMELYPLTLEDFLWSEQNGRSKELNMKYCFHTSEAVQILSAILDGVEYIHSQGMVHRDLKPGNILLSVHNGSTYSSAGSIDISSCLECANSPGGQHTFITPHIGDFGLIAEIRKPEADSARTPRGEHVFEPTELARLAPAGSKFYMPQAPVDVICPKLDVYSLGVVAFELLYKFGTKSERMLVLEKLKMGEFPSDFEYHEMTTGIKAMICGSRDERWTCANIRKWIQDTQERYRRQ